MAEVDVEGLLGHQVHGRRGAAKRIEHEHVEGLAALRLELPLEHEPPVAEHDLGVRLAVPEKRKVPVGEREHGRIELVVADQVALAPQRRDHAGAKPDDADPDGRTGAAAGIVREREADAAGVVVAADELHSALGRLELLALLGAGLHQV